MDTKQGSICIRDVVVQILTSVAYGLYAGDVDVMDTLARMGFCVPVALVVVAIYRQTTGNWGWIKRRSTRFEFNGYTHTTLD